MQDTLITSEDRAYFTMIPNMVDDMALSVYAFRLYCHIRRVAGEGGACWQGTSTLAETCKMSAGKVSAAKQELAEAGLIQVEFKNAKNYNYHHITVKDVWGANMAKYTVQDVKDSYLSPDEQYRSPGERHRSPGETKKNPVKKNAGEEKPAATAALPEKWLVKFMDDYLKATGEPAIKELAEQAVDKTLAYINGKDYSVLYNFTWIQERYALLSRTAQKATRDYSVPDDDGIPDDEFQDDGIPEVSEKLIRQFEALSQTWPIAWRVNMEPLAETTDLLRVGVRGLSVDVAQAHYKKTLENTFMKPVYFEVMQ